MAFLMFFFIIILEFNWVRWVVWKIEVLVQISGLFQSLRRKEIASVCVAGWVACACVFTGTKTIVCVSLWVCVYVGS